MSEALFAWEPHTSPESLSADVLAVSLGAFVDAGSSQQILTHHLLDGLPSHVVGRFDADQLIDHREQRPPITFDRDHFSDYTPPSILLREMTDLAGRTFLYLEGPEPVLKWERLAETVSALLRDVGVQRTVMLQAVPMPMPHTRPLHVTRHATDASLIPGNQPMFGSITMPATFGSVLELRLGERGHDALGLSVHIPQYLTQFEYPDGALTLLSALQDATGLNLPGEGLLHNAELARQTINQQVAESEELTEMVAALEAQYDEFMHRRELEAEVHDLPSADEIGAEAEEFLRTLGLSGQSDSDDVEG